MNSKVTVVGIIALVIGLAGGFLLANNLNRSTINALRSQLDSRGGNANTSGGGNDLGVSDDEIRAKIAEADANPQDLVFQKNLGRGIYRLAAMKKDVTLIEEGKRLLERANTLDPKDVDVLVDLGNAEFDIAFFRKDPKIYLAARDAYQKALAVKPDDADVITDMALTYYLTEPPDLKQAADQFQKAIKINPKQERALQFLTSTFIRQSDFDSAKKVLDQLKAANPKNELIKELSSQIDNRTYSPIH